MISLEGRSAIITGATQGLGTDIAERLHEAGASVTVVGRGGKRGAEITARLGERALFVETDIADDASIAACVDATLARFGRIDILVNNACMYDDRGMDASRAEWHRLFDVNLIGAAIFSAAVVDHMAGDGSTIVNIGSIGGKYGAVGRMLYPASKAALLQITKNMAVTLAPRGIRVVSVSPAVTWSPSVEKSTGSIEVADRLGAVLHPLGRIGRGREVADAVLFACSPMASFITGTDIAVDGGFTAIGPDQGKGPRPWMDASIHRG
jgi:NAD(P)-dependent dehydrogenase (short-subunit alcohol dehydrogenase family)